MWIPIDSRIRINAWETANTSAYVTLTVRVETVGAQSITITSGTLTVNGQTYTASGSSNGTGDAEAIFTRTGCTAYYGGASSLSVGISCNITYAYESGGAIYPGNTVTASGSYSATKPVTAAISTSANSVTLGNSINITTSGGSAGAMTFKVGGSVIETKANIGNTTTSWTPSLANYAGLNTTGTSMTCTITWNGITKNVTLVIPQNSSTKPTASVTMSVNSGGLSGLYVQGKSTAKATVSTTTKYSAKISSVSVTMNGTTIAATATDGTKVTWTATSGLLTTSGSNTCSVTITDTRGFTNTASATFTVQAYSSPTLSGVSIFRSTSGGTASTTGTYIRFNFTPTISPVTSGGTSYNAKTYKLRYKLQTASTWTETSGTLSSYTAATGYTVGGGSIATTSAYDAQLTITDSFETVYSASFSIPTEAVMMDFNSAGTGGGIGMYTQAAGQLDIAWNIKGHGTLDTTNYPLASTRITPTYTTNSYCSSTSVGRVWIRRQGAFGFLHFNLSIDSTALTSSAGFVEIMRFSGVTLAQDEYCTIPSQSGQSTLLMQILTTGIVKIYTDYGSASGFYRAEMPLIFA